MKRKQLIKQCKGFEKENCCYLCIRQNDDCKERLVRKLAIDPDNGRRYCNYYITY